MEGEGVKIRYVHRSYNSQAMCWEFLLVFIMPLIFWVVPPVFAASFDCSKAATEMEKTVCSDSKLSALDEDLTKVYGEIKKHLKDEENLLKEFTKSQREWLAGLKQKKDGNIACTASKECLTISYQKRIKELQTKRDLLLKKASSAGEKIRRIRTGPGYQKFILTKGKGVEVCEAYLNRLNKTWFEKLPFCDRPENTDVPGFEKLNRVALTAEEIYPIEYRIRDFIYTGNQYIHDKSDEMRPENKEKVIFFIKQGLELQSLGAYRYDPRIDFDNDQKPDNLLVWKESRFSCGSIHEEYGLFPELGMIIALILEPDSLSVDEKKTKTLIGHPIGGYPKPDGKGFFDNRFRPVGDSMGIFRFKGATYFDTFFDTWGDFEGKRRKDPNIWRTLGAFKREKGQTKQVCEYVWEIPYEQENQK